LQNATAILVTGRDLRASRVLHGVRAHELAVALGVSDERVRQFERRALLSDRDVERYCSALSRVLGAARVA